MNIDGPHHIITESGTGKSEPRRLLTLKEVAFNVRMGLMKSTGLAGIRGRARDERERQLAADIADHFKLSGYKVFCGFSQPGPMSVGRPTKGEGGSD